MQDFTRGEQLLGEAEVLLSKALQLAPDLARARLALWEAYQLYKGQQEVEQTVTEWAR